MFLIRSVDDLFIKWTDSVEELLEFKSNTNKKRSSFKYKVKWSQTPADKHLRNIIGTKLIENVKMKGKLRTTHKVNVLDASPTTEHCAINKSQKRTEYFWSIKIAAVSM